ncbi:MAG: hypothetical protein K1X55_13595 [Chitinophagales bacterium]|nr:hypothetical protein [Chitinophagales bacterium]
MRTALIFIVFIGIIRLSYAQSQEQPEPFIPTIVSKFPAVRDIAISPKGDEAYFSIQTFNSELSYIVVIRKKGKKWSSPQMASFSGKYNDLEPTFSPDGKKLFFVSNRPLNDTTSEAKDFDIWYVERNDISSAWNKPINPGVPVNSTDNEFFPSLTTSNHLYFTSDGINSKGKDDIFVCQWNGQHYNPPISVSDSINTSGYEFNAFVAPDESYIIFTGYNKADGFGSGDLYISFHKDGVWSSPQNLGEKINAPQMDYCPYVDTQGILYFTSRRTAFSPTPKENMSLEEALEEMNKYENGSSRLYKVDISDIIE